MADVRFNPDATVRLDDAGLGATLAGGQRFLGRYVLLAELGRGGMGVVWRATDETLGETVALKFLPEFVARDAVALDELKQETRRARRLTHPNIVRVHDFSQAEGQAAVSMEYVDGMTLTHRRLELPGRIFSIAALAPLAEQLCAALEYAHRAAKTAHRDLKPANILITRAGDVKVTDFGISRSLTETRTRLTMPGKSGVSGTLPYMSPQQLRGDKPQATDDIYALGATFYELLAGKPPFHRGDLASLMLQIRHRPPPSIAETRKELEVEGDPVPREWEDTIMACLAKEAAARPQSAADVAAGFGLDGSAPAEPAPPPVQGEQTQADGTAQRRGGRWLIAGGVAVILAVAALLWWPSGAGPTPATEASKPARTPLAKELPPGGKKEVVAPDPKVSAPVAAPALVPAIAREFVVTVLPPEAAARLWLGPISELAVAGGRAVLPSLPDGEHELVVQAAGYEAFTAKVTIKDGRGQAEVRLVHLKGGLEITARPGTRVEAKSTAGEKIAVGTIGAGGVLAANGVLAIGSYVVRLEHDDCEALEAGGVELAVGRVTRLAPTQVPLPGELGVKSMPPGAEIRLNGVALGRTPTVLAKLASEQSLRVELLLAGHRRAEQTVRLAARERRELDFGALEPEVGKIALQLANPAFPMAEAEMRVDGKRVTAKKTGDDWAVENVGAGARVFEILHRDYEPWKQTVDVRDRQDSSVTATPIARPAVVNLDVGGPPNYVVLIEGKPVDVVGNRLTLPAGEGVRMEVRAARFRPVYGNLKLPANKQGTLAIVLEPQPLPRAGQPHENSLHMKFVPVPGLGVLVSIWETRMQDFEKYFYAKNQKVRWPAAPMEPAVGMSWYEARAFCQWLTEVERAEGNLGPAQQYRLPTDAEWSVAVGLGRESGKTPAEKDRKIRDMYPWGKSWPPPARAGNFAGDEGGAFTSLISGYQDGFAKVAPVGSFAANGAGLFDLGGNVWEWCEDEYRPGSGERVGRGGSFHDHDPTMLLSSARVHPAPSSVNNNVGFRCVLETVGTNQ